MRHCRGRLWLHMWTVDLDIEIANMFIYEAKTSSQRGALKWSSRTIIRNARAAKSPIQRKYEENAARVWRCVNEKCKRAHMIAYSYIYIHTFERVLNEISSLVMNANNIYMHIIWCACSTLLCNKRGLCKLRFWSAKNEGGHPA